MTSPPAPSFIDPFYIPPSQEILASQPYSSPAIPGANNGFSKISISSKNHHRPLDRVSTLDQSDVEWSKPLLNCTEDIIFDNQTTQATSTDADDSNTPSNDLGSCPSLECGIEEYFSILHAPLGPNLEALENPPSPKVYSAGFPESLSLLSNLDSQDDTVHRKHGFSQNIKSSGQNIPSPHSASLYPFDDDQSTSDTSSLVFEFLSRGLRNDYDDVSQVFDFADNKDSSKKIRCPLFPAMKLHWCQTTQPNSPTAPSASTGGFIPKIRHFKRKNRLFKKSFNYKQTVLEQFH